MNGRHLVAGGLVWALIVPAALTSAAELTVRVCGFESRIGNLRIAVFSRKNAEEFKNPDSDEFAAGITIRLAATETKPTLRFTLPSLSPGEYAIRVLHDKDFDKKLGILTEPYGYSRNARAMFGPASFDDAAITIAEEPLSTEVRLTSWSFTGGDATPCPP